MNTGAINLTITEKAIVFGTILNAIDEDYVELEILRLAKVINKLYKGTRREEKNGTITNLINKLMRNVLI
ncbi:hypothetical protein ACQGSX_14700 [Bacillus sp. GMs2/1]|uniref:hypothetical protein n=1 Tax=Bacillus sp. GMs2/1 TaxID=3418493 RepID=UPI003CEBA0D7